MTEIVYTFSDKRQGAEPLSSSLDADVGGVATVARLADEALVAEALEDDRDHHDADVGYRSSIPRFEIDTSDTSYATIWRRTPVRTLV